MNENKIVDSHEREALLKALKVRFEKNMNRHQGADWNDILKRLDGNHGKLWSLGEMERTGGEPDVVSFDSAIPMRCYSRTFSPKC